MQTVPGPAAEYFTSMHIGGRWRTSAAVINLFTLPHCALAITSRKSPVMIPVGGKGESSVRRWLPSGCECVCLWPTEGAKQLDPPVRKEYYTHIKMPLAFHTLLRP